MSDRIDHAAMAREYIAAAFGEVTADPASVVALLAQAEATLALVEQQRIANLIALAPDNLALLGRLARAELQSKTGDIRPHIAAALGIEVQP